MDATAGSSGVTTNGQDADDAGSLEGPGSGLSRTRKRKRSICPGTDEWETGDDSVPTIGKGIGWGDFAFTPIPGRTGTWTRRTTDAGGTVWTWTARPGDAGH